jgi:hypothetical protein
MLASIVMIQQCINIMRKGHLDASQNAALQGICYQHTEELISIVDTDPSPTETLSVVTG